MSYECTYCNFNAPTNTRLNRHLSTQKHIRNVLSKQIHDESQNILNEIIEEIVQEKEEEVVELCENMDCLKYPEDWDFESDTPETYEEGQWVKCAICPGYFNDDGLGDILFIEEAPNNRGGGCDLCGKTDNIVQMKGSGQYLCGDACDEEEEEEVSQSDILPNDTIQIESVQEETIIQKEQKLIFDIEEEREVTIDNILLNNSIIMNSVQEDKKEVVKFDENIEYIENSIEENSIEENSIESEIIFIEIPILDIQTIEMLKDFNEFVTTHGFLLNILSFIMNIVRFFAPNNTGVSPL
jgi:hypothetical protein